VDAGGDRRLAAEHPFCRHPRTVIALGFCPPALCHSAQPAGGWGGMAAWRSGEPALPCRCAAGHAEAAQRGPDEPLTTVRGSAQTPQPSGEHGSGQSQQHGGRGPDGSA